MVTGQESWLYEKKFALVTSAMLQIQRNLKLKTKRDKELTKSNKHYRIVTINASTFAGMEEVAVDRKVSGCVGGESL